MTWVTGATTIVSGLFASASGLTQELVSNDALLRAPLALSRRIGFVQLAGGSGASTAAAYTSSLLAHRRAGMVLAVNASAGGANILSRAGFAGSGTLSEGERRAHARTARDAHAGLPVAGSGLFGLDLAVGGIAASPGTWFEQVTPIARFYDVVCTDWGVRHRQVDLRQVAAASHVVCLVARADRHAAEQAASLVSALGEIEDQPMVVVALVDVGRTGERTPQLLRDRLDVPVLKIPYEPLRAAPRPQPSADLPAGTRLAQTRLATALMRQAQRVDLRRRPLRAAGPAITATPGPRP